MRRLPSILTSALLFTLASTVYAQADMQDIQNPMNNPQVAPSPSDSSSMQNGTNNMQATPSETPAIKTQSTAPSKTRNMPLTFTPDTIQWKPAPKMLPPGAQYVIFEGSRRGRGITTLRIKLPANYQIPPVYTQNVERITVLSGTVNLGIGDKLDTSTSTPLPVGSFVLMPAQRHHYVWTSEEVVIQITGLSPWRIKYVNPKDDPRRNPAPTNRGIQDQSNITTPSPSSSQPNPEPGSDNQMNQNNVPNNVPTTPETTPAPSSSY